MSVQDQALPIPDEVLALEDPGKAIEFIRAWWDGGQPRMVIRPVFDEPAAIGKLLAELSWHFSNAYAGKYGLDQAEAFAAIRTAWGEAHERADAARSGGSQ
ncbi:MAG: DUF5076 domain-containing protein [Brevundimonas sp.]|uniref:DUF5076 domain-containing protein n=1 Tax=Brevundimonas sp. TaxID=1871086 RepID=UPI00391B3409